MFDFRRLVVVIEQLFGNKGEKATVLRDVEVLAIAAENEKEKAETPAKMEGWRDLVSGGAFTLEVIKGGEHQELVDQDSGTKEMGKGFALVLQDLAKVIA